jgi:hypothetical protein
MSKQSRRQFMSTAAKAIAVTSLMGAKPAEEAPKVFIHHVYFWLNNPESKEDKDKLIAGLRKLAVTAKTIRQHHIGLPSTTDRDVVERSYQVSWMLFFKNKAEQDIYQTDPAHLSFVKECSSVWKKVIVYDAEDI